MFRLMERCDELSLGGTEQFQEAVMQLKRRAVGWLAQQGPRVVKEFQAALSAPKSVTVEVADEDGYKTRRTVVGKAEIGAWYEQILEYLGRQGFFGERPVVSTVSRPTDR